MKSENNSRRILRNWKKNTIFLMVLFLVTVICNLLARFVNGFADWHIKYVLPVWINTYGRFTSLFPFSVGEVLFLLGIVLTFVLLIALLLLVFQKTRGYSKKYLRIYMNIVVIVSFIMTQNCFIEYQSSTFVEKYGISQTCITKKNLIIMRNHIVHEVNQMAETFDRDENGDIIFHGNIFEQAKIEMKRLGETYSQLSGYYVTPKKIYHSAFLSQQYISGYYFPFSMEANLNSYQYELNLPTTACHELAHTKGFLLEDEANFIGFLACIDSNESYFKYAAYLSVLYYVEDAYNRTIRNEKEAYQDAEQISDLVNKDNIFLTKEAWDKVERVSLFSPKSVKKATEVFLNTNLKANGVSDGTVSYSRVVRLLLTYYDGKLW